MKTQLDRIATGSASPKTDRGMGSHAIALLPQSGPTRGFPSLAPRSDRFERRPAVTEASRRALSAVLVLLNSYEDPASILSPVCLTTLAGHVLAPINAHEERVSGVPGWLTQRRVPDRLILS